MIITVFSTKGGVGKTAIALNLALEFKYKVITNDLYVPLEEVIGQGNIRKLRTGEQIRPNDFKKLKEYNCIFDLGGYIDERMPEIIEQSDIVLLPVVNEDYMSLQVSFSSIQFVLTRNKNVVVIINKYNPNPETKELVSELKKHFPEVPLFYLKYSKGLQKCSEDATSIIELSKKKGLRSFWYSEPAKQFKEILDFVGGKNEQV